jgi:hypothetical protein
MSMATEKMIVNTFNDKFEKCIKSVYSQFSGTYFENNASIEHFLRFRFDIFIENLDDLDILEKIEESDEIFQNIEKEDKIDYDQFFDKPNIVIEDIRKYYVYMTMQHLMQSKMNKFI